MLKSVVREKDRVKVLCLTNYKQIITVYIPSRLSLTEQYEIVERLLLRS